MAAIMYPFIKIPIKVPQNDCNLSFVMQSGRALQAMSGAKPNAWMISL
jgi:hypothetical protein